MFTSNNQIILEENIDENFQPTEEEILEYAEFIGIDTENVFISSFRLKIVCYENFLLL